MLIRVRLEASAKTIDGIKDDLIGGFAILREAVGGEWVDSHDPVRHGPVLQTTKDGYWGYLIMERDVT